MAFEGNYVLSQSSPSTISLTDTSTGTDSNLTSRYIYLFKYNNTTIVPSGTTTTYIVWPIADTEITLTDILDTDYCLNVRVVWNSSSPDPSGTYTKTEAYCFKDYNEEFMMALTSEQNVAMPTVVNDTTFITKWMTLRLYVDAAKQIIDNASDVMNGQININKANYIRTNESFYF